jgi:hypothetical protein
MGCVIMKKLRHRPTGRLDFGVVIGCILIDLTDLASGWRKKAKCSGRALFSWALLKWKENMLARSCVKRYETFKFIISESLVLIISLFFSFWKPWLSDRRRVH